MSIATFEARPVDSVALLRERLTESAVLVRLLDEHPRTMSVAELAREVGGGCQHRVVARAVANLVGAELLRHDGDAVAPASAVIAVDRGSVPAAGR